MSEDFFSDDENINGSYPGLSAENSDPEEKKKKKRPIWLKIIVAILSLIAELFLFAVFLGFLVRGTIDGISFTKEQFISPFENVKAGDIKIGKVLNQMNLGKKFDEDMTLADELYELIPEEYRYMTNREELTEILNNSDKLVKFVAEKGTDYMYTISGAQEEAHIGVDEIMELIDSYEPEVAKIFEQKRIFDEKEKERIRKLLTDSRIEETSRFNREKVGLDDSTNIPLLISRTKKDSYVILSVAAAVLILVLLLLDLRRKRRVLLIIAVISLCTSIAGGIGVAFMDSLIESFKKEIPYTGTFIDGISGNIKNSLTGTAATFHMLWLTFLIAYLAVRILPWLLAKIKNRRRSEEKT